MNSFMYSVIGNSLDEILFRLVHLQECSGGWMLSVVAHPAWDVPDIAFG